jgi:NADPH:quinone reductase-like Zn-dependent oxidoreductase
MTAQAGGELAGIIDDLGEDVSGFKIGDAVYGIMPSGRIAEDVGASARNLAYKPANLDFGRMAAPPLEALTTSLAMVETASLPVASVG